MSLFGRKSNSSPSFPSVKVLTEWIDTIRSIYQQELNREPDSSGLANYLALAYQGWNDSKIRADVQSSQEYKNKHSVPTPVQVPQLIPNNRLFINNVGTIVQWRGFTAFNLLDRFTKGQNIDSFLGQFTGFNIARVFLYTPVSDWKESAWDIPSNEAVLAFLLGMKLRGFNVELTLITDNDSSKLVRISDLVNYLNQQTISNLLLEAVNEPFVNSKLDPELLRNILTSSKFIYTSGIYTDNRKFYGKYWVDHSERDTEWTRRAHNLLDAHNGGGPNFPDEPKLDIPGVEDEPIRPDQTSFDFIKFYTYAASCTLFGAGATFHCLSAELTDELSPNELSCKDWFLRGLKIFPNDACLGSYRRIDEPNALSGARTYVVGNYSIRIGQATKEHPESGWNSLDDYGICWSR